MKQGTINTFLHQKVNSYLCFALIGLMTFWTVLYYATSKATLLAETYTADYSTVGR